MSYFFQKKKRSTPLETDKELINSAILKAILEGNSNPSIVTDEKQTILNFNAAAEEIFGYLKEEVLGLNIEFLISYSFKEKFDKVTSLQKNSLGKRKDGSIFPIYLSVTATITNGSKLFVNFIQDITKEKEAEIILVAYLFNLSEMKIKNDFLSTLAHEIKTPLHSIMGFTECLIEGLDGPLQPAQKTSLDSLYASSKTLLNLVDGMFQLSKKIPDEINLTVEPCFLTNILDSCLDEVSFLAKQKHLEIRKDFSVEVFVNANPQNLKEIFLNLLTNSIRFSENTILTIKVQSIQGKATVSLTGSGCKINEKDLLEIFTPFWMIPKGSPEGHQGLGLAVTKRLIELHGGVVEVINEEGIGSTFSIHLPTAQKP